MPEISHKQTNSNLNSKWLDVPLMREKSRKSGSGHLREFWKIPISFSLPHKTIIIIIILENSKKKKMKLVLIVVY